MISLKTQGGANRARNAGADLARGTHLAFLDSDDQFDPDKISRQLRAMARFDKPFSVTGYRTDDGQIRTLPRFSRARLLRHNCLGGTSGLVVRKDLFLQERFDPDMKAVQDWDLFLRLSRHATPVVLKSALYTYGTECDDRITQDHRARALGHFQFYRRHIAENPSASPAVRKYHRQVQSHLVQLARPDRTSSKATQLAQRVALKIGTL